MYLDSAYIAKFYVNESDSKPVRKLIAGADSLISSAWSLAEVTCVFHRHMREGSLTSPQCRELARAFSKHIDQGVWTLLPITDSILKRMSLLVSSAPASAYLRAGDAVHLTTAHHAGEHEIWTNDRHLLQAARHFGLTGRSILLR